MDNSYNLYNGYKRGLAYIIVNEEFKHHEKRNGAERDYQNMKKVFGLLGFKLVPFRNKKAKEIIDILTEASQREDLHQRSSFVCVISSHGGQRSVGLSGGKTAKYEHYVVGSDSQDVDTRTLIDMFSSSNCSGLKDKPKLFFIQACRTDETEEDETKMYDDGFELKMIKYKEGLKKIKKRRHGHDAVDDASSTQEVSTFSTQLYSSSVSEVKKDVKDDDSWLDKYLSEEYIIDTTDDESDEKDVGRDKSEVKTIYKCTTDAPVTKKSDDKEPVNKKGKLESESKSMDKTDKGVRPKAKRGESDKAATAVEEILECPCYEDMLVMFASPLGKTAWRDEWGGGWLLFCLHTVVLEHMCKDDINKVDFLSLLTEVSGKVSFWMSDTGEKISTGKMMIPVINHKLIKQIYFRVTPWDVFITKLKKILF